MTTASVRRVGGMTAVTSAAKGMTMSHFLNRLAKTFVLLSAGMLYQNGNYSEEMAYAARDAYEDR